MSATIIDGKKIAAEVLAGLSEELGALRERGAVPGLATVLVGDDPASATYVRNKHRKARELGLFSVEHVLPAATPSGALLELIDQLNADPRIDGILVQLPLPAHLDPLPVVTRIDPLKDVDGQHPVNAQMLAAGQPRLVPCTPAGCLHLLDAVGVALEGARAVVIGRSGLVGRPLAQLLLARHCTVTQCHSRTRDLAEEVGRGDVVAAAIGKPGLVRGSWLKPGAVVIDVGTSRGEDGKLVGDVEFAAAVERAAAITPVPGGVGPMTIAMLMANTVRAARLRRQP
ncbi:MAG: bifunctional methylenetetrahydrofolate dehydrogenase/methenyltetrahydrofolate cyclohydrolase [Deltaproteobacteria bacterium]|nr:bifunctional methylenetetrahydrofolate dehydrogenase/methenyltetrahydrofolate cyclohydrolase [Deltaproteobacteria bacterium]